MNKLKSDFSPELQGKESLEEAMNMKQDEYFAARHNNQPELADKIQDEYLKLRTELRLIDPDAKLLSSEQELKDDADFLNNLYNAMLNDKAKPAKWQKN